MNHLHTDSTALQIRSLREALELSGRAASNAEDLAASAIRDAQIERQRVRQLREALESANKQLLQVEAENRRLRSLVGGVLAENNSLTTELRCLGRVVGVPCASSVSENPSINEILTARDEIEAA